MTGETLTHLQRAARKVLTDYATAHGHDSALSWVSTVDVTLECAASASRSVLMSDVAAALRALKRAGLVESRSIGTNGKAWRIARQDGAA
jgi:hypothetical protein